MANIDLGRVIFEHQGEFDVETAYVFFDTVSYLGSSYVCMSTSGTTAGTLPTDTDYWALFASKGEDGQDGAADFDFDTLTLNEFVKTLGTDQGAIRNGYYRGQSLGDTYTDAQKLAVSSGTFDDMFIGDYWEIDGIKWRIAAFDYYMGTGDDNEDVPNVIAHHVTIVPDTALASTYMKYSGSATGGYVNSYVYTTKLPSLLIDIKTRFGDEHVLTHRSYLCNAAASSGGYQSGGAWYTRQIDIMSEAMAYGKIMSVMKSSNTVPIYYTVDHSVLPLFRLNKSMIHSGVERQSAWLRDVTNTVQFALISGYGNAATAVASISYGIRPVFSLVG